MKNKKENIPDIDEGFKNNLKFLLESIKDMKNEEYEMDFVTKDASAG